MTKIGGEEEKKQREKKTNKKDGKFVWTPKIREEKVQGSVWLPYLACTPPKIAGLKR